MLYSEQELAGFTPEFREYLRLAAKELSSSSGQRLRGTQMNVALSYWLAQRSNQR